MLLRWKLNDRFIKYHVVTLLVIFVIVLVIRHIFEVAWSYSNCNSLDETIDVVYTWVNGSDPKFLQDLTNLVNKKSNLKTDVSEQRFDDKYELKFSLRSLEKYAPWIRHVYIVTNGQIPYWLNLDYEKVSIVTHDEIFLDNADLPTFSSPAIESHIHRIKGLSQRFIYFNDDILLGAPIYLDDFISKGRGFLVYLAWPLPMCAVDCPWLYVQDGQCDESCYNQACQMDGGDCDDNSQVKSEKSKRKLHNDDMLDSEYFSKSIAKPKKLTSYDIMMNYLKLSHGGPFRNNTTSLTRRDIAYYQKASRLGLSVPTYHKESLDHQHVLEQPRESSTPKISNTFIKLLNNTNRSLTDVVKYHNRKTILLDKKQRKKYRKRHGNLLLDKIKEMHGNFDAYSASLQHTNRILNLAYGFRTRRVPSHAPIFIDKYIMAGMQTKFEKEFKVTSNNRLRSTDDVQYSFSYYYFLMSEENERSISEIFDMFDTDNSGTWSDREIRTILTRLYELPLSYLVVDHFESILLNCSELVGEQDSTLSTPEYERYLDSRLPTVTKYIVVQCASLRAVLVKAFKKSQKYQTEVLKNTEDSHVTFKMLNSNVSDVVMHLDEIRSKPKKFVCLNDNLDESKKSDNELIKAVLYDFYLSLFPHPSKFELPSTYKNRFLYMEDLRAWRTRHFIIKVIVYILVIILLYCCLFSICKRGICLFINKLFYTCSWHDFIMQGVPQMLEQISMRGTKLRKSFYRHV